MATPLGYADLPLDMRGLILQFVIEKTSGSYKTLFGALSALYTLDRDACGNIWRTTFEKAFGVVPDAEDGDDTLCPPLLGVHTWRQALVRTYKALMQLPHNENWRWERMPLWSQKGMDARLSLLGHPIPAGALADLLRARGASLVRLNRSIIRTYELTNVISSLNSTFLPPGARADVLDAALRLINEGANAAYACHWKRGYPALHIACMGTDPAPVRMLLENGADLLLNHACGGTPRAQEEIPRTPLMLADSAPIWNVLLEARADPNHHVFTHENKRMYALTFAARENQLEKVRALLMVGADPRLDGGDALYWARKNDGAEAHEILSLLERHTR